MTEEIKTDLKESLKEQFQEIKQEFLSSTHTEFQAALRRFGVHFSQIFRTIFLLCSQTDQILQGFNAIATAAGLAEIANEVDALKDWVAELSKSVTLGANDVKNDFRVISTLSDMVSKCSDTVTRMASQLDTQKGLIVNALKVSIIIIF